MAKQKPKPDPAFLKAQAGNASARQAEKIAAEQRLAREAAAAAQLARERLITTFSFKDTHGGNSASDLGRAGRRGFDVAGVSYLSFMAYGKLVARPLPVSVTCAGHTRTVYFGGGTIALEEKVEAFKRWFISLTPHTKRTITFPEAFVAPDPLPKSYDTLWVAQEFWRSPQASVMWSLQSEVTSLFLSCYETAAAEVTCDECGSHEVALDVQNSRPQSGITFRKQCNRCHSHSRWHVSTH